MFCLRRVGNEPHQAHGWLRGMRLHPLTWDGRQQHLFQVGLGTASRRIYATSLPSARVSYRLSELKTQCVLLFSFLFPFFPPFFFFGLQFSLWSVVENPFFAAGSVTMFRPVVFSSQAPCDNFLGRHGLPSASTSGCCCTWAVATE